MGQNAIEIVFDTSKSMQEQVFSAIELSKFKLAKEILFNIFNRWNNYDCQHQLYIRCLRESKIIAFNNINEFEQIEAKEKDSLSNVIQASILNLKTLEKRYKRKIILIITDGKNSYTIDKTLLTSDITIYTMEIKGEGGRVNSKLRNLAKWTKGKSYSVFVKDTDESDIKKLYSKIEGYLNCLTFPKITLISIFLLTIPLYLFTPKGCNNYNTQLLQDSNISSCKNDTINGIKLTKCSIPNQSVEATIYNYGSFKIVSLQNFSTAKSTISESYQNFLKEILERLNRNQPKSIKIFGHTDLEGINSKNEHDFNQNCKKYHLPKYTNSCLGTDRAFQVKKILLELDYNNTFISAEYAPDFFMKKINDQLNGTLWRALNLTELVTKLMQQLKIKELYNIKEVREDKRVQQEIERKKNYYQEKFIPFRNTVILIEN